MSDAWNAIGWTAQQPATYYTEDSMPGSWKLPADVPTVNVSGTFGDADGGRPTGYVLFEGSSALKHVPTGAIILQPHFYAIIGHDGTVKTTVPATDSTVLVPTSGDFHYSVTVVLNRKMFQRFDCALPSANTDVDLQSITPLPTA